MAPLFAQRALTPFRAQSPSPHEALSLLTLNVWFGAHEQLRRAHATVQLIEQLAPTVVALQEVTGPFLDVLAASPLAAQYHASDLEGSTFDDYGIVLLSRAPFEDLFLAEIGGSMGRTMPWGVIAHGGERVAVGAVHLESGRHNAPTRAEQLVECFARLSPFDHAVLLGDTNFGDGDPHEEGAIPAEWIDAWRAKHPLDPGYTRDTGRNPMAAALRNGDLVQRRIDRVLTRSSRFQVSSAAIVADQPIAEGVFASDHFGLLVELG